MLSLIWHLPCCKYKNISIPVWSALSACELQCKNKKVLLHERKRHTTCKRAQDADPPLLDWPTPLAAGPDPPPSWTDPPPPAARPDPPPLAAGPEPSPPSWTDLPGSWTWPPPAGLTPPGSWTWPKKHPPPSSWTWPPPCEQTNKVRL